LGRPWEGSDIGPARFQRAYTSPEGEKDGALHGGRRQVHLKHDSDG